MSTGVFNIRISHAGPRPQQPHQIAVRAARQRASDARVADLLAEERSLVSIAGELNLQRSKVNAAFRRICAGLGPQALGEWRLPEGSFER